MVIKINPYGTPHHLIHDKEAIFLEPGTRAYIGLEKKKILIFYTTQDTNHIAMNQNSQRCLMQLQLKKFVADEFDGL